MTNQIVSKSINNQTSKPFSEKMKTFVNSNLAMFIVSFIIVFCWALDIAYVSIFLLSIFVICVFYFSEDNVSAFMLPFFSFFYIATQNYARVIDFISYGFGILTLIFLFSRHIYRQVKKQKKLKRGKMFFPIMIIILSTILAGHADILSFIFFTAVSFLAYGIYWFSLNFFEDFKKYFAKVLIFLALILSAQVILYYLTAPDIMFALEKKLVRIGSGEINTAAFFMTLGVCACFYLADKEKFNFRYILLALVFDIMIFFTYSRIALFIAVLANIVYFIILLFKHSQNKKQIFIILGVSVAVLAVLAIILFEKFNYILSYYIRLAFKPNGRDDLWSWCWQKFLSSPIFGIGFTTTETLFGEAGPLRFVLCHNTILHFLTCTGIVGLLLAIPFYVGKYKTIFKKFNKFKLFCLFMIIAFAIDGLVEVAPTMDVISVFIIMIIIAFAEKDTAYQEKFETENTKLLKKAPTKKKEKSQKSDKKLLQKTNPKPDKKPLNKKSIES